jgi:hypothetical protein
MLKQIQKLLKKMNIYNVLLIILVIIILNNLVRYSSKENFESALPKGIPKNEIPDGEEDLYIKKTEIVPPVCPRCPDLIQKDIDESKCPPCPACKRCPAPAEVECKKVFKYDENREEEVINKNIVGNRNDGIVREKVFNTNAIGERNLNDTHIQGNFNTNTFGSILDNSNQVPRPLVSDFSNF